MVKMKQDKYKEYLASTIPPAGKEPGDLGVWRSKLLYFLTFSQYYKAEIIMVHLPHDCKLKSLSTWHK